MTPRRRVLSQAACQRRRVRVQQAMKKLQGQK